MMGHPVFHQDLYMTLIFDLENFCIDLEKGLGERVLEQVPVLPLDYLVVQSHLAVRQARLPLERLKVEYDQQAGRREVLGDEYIALILTLKMAQMWPKNIYMISLIISNAIEIPP